MRYDPKRHHRRSIRLTGYDYSQEGGYFITLTTRYRKCLFGEIVDGEMRLSETGRIAERCWKELPQQFENIGLDDFVVMPDHMHAIVIIQRRGLINQTPTEDQFKIPSTDKLKSRLSLMTTPEITLGRIIRHFKARAARIIRTTANPDFKWQRNYYERIIRDLDELGRIRECIRKNVLQLYYDWGNRP